MKKTNSLLRGLTYFICCLSISTFAQVFPGPGANTPMPSNDCYDFTLSVGGVTEDLTQVSIDVQHTWNSDLVISLIAPDGNSIILSDSNGGSGDNYSGTVFTDDATQSITDGSSPFTGEFNPEVPLSTFAGQGNGNWTLRICDNVGGDDGTLLGWSLRFGTPPPPPPPAPQDVYMSTVVEGAIPDNTCPETTDFPLDVSGVTEGFALAEVVINIEHTWVGDLEVSLVAPDGAFIILTDDNGSSGDNFTDTSFRDDASTSITDISSYQAPFTNTYRPEQPLITFIEQTDGEWNLRICDDVNNDIGRLISWTLIFETAPLIVSIEQDCITSFNDYCAEITPEVSYGTPPYTYLWSDGSVTDTVTACIAENTVYSVTVTDAAGDTATDEILVIYSPEDVACQNNKVMVCHNKGNGESSTICVSQDALQAHLDHGDSLGSCDYYTCASVPSCISSTSIISPGNGAENVETPVTIEWEDTSLGLVDGFKVSIGTTPGGTDLVDHVDVGLDLEYTTPVLPLQSMLFVTVTPYNANGEAEGCESSVFTTQKNPCSNAPYIYCGDTDIPGDTSGAPVNPSIESCDVTLNTTPGDWYRFTGTGDLITVDTNGSYYAGDYYNTRIGVFEGNCEGMVCIAGDDNGGEGYNDSSVTFISEVGVNYLIYVTGYSYYSDGGAYILNLSCEYLEPCDDNRLELNIVTDTWGYETSWQITDENGLVVDSGSGYSNNSSNLELPCLPDGCYEFTIFDEFEDGIYSPGGYSLSFGDDIIVSDYSNGFGDFATTSFCIPIPDPEPTLVDCSTDLNETYCYANNADTFLWYTSSNGFPLTITFNSGYIEGSSFDFIKIYDGNDSSGTLIYSNPTDYGVDLTGVTATADSGSLFITIVSDGSVDCASYFDDSRIWDFDLSCNGPSGSSSRLSNINNEVLDWSMAPNPTKGNVTLDLSNYILNTVTIDVVDYTGKVISTATVNEVQSAKYTLELRSSLPAGMYFVRVTSAAQVSTKKLMIMR